MKKQLIGGVPTGIELKFPRKDVIQLEVHWANKFTFWGLLLVASIMIIIVTVLLCSMIHLEYWGVKILFLVTCSTVAYFCWQKAKIARKGYAQILLTPKEIQKQLYYDSDGKEWGEKKYMRWRDLEMFMPVNPSTSKEISITGDNSRQYLNRELNWQELGTMRMWVKQQFKSFSKYYNANQEQYIEQWMEVQYQYYRTHVEVDQLDADYFLKIDEKEAPLLLDLSQHLIEVD